MPAPLKVLLVEDNADDAKLVLRELNRSGFEVAMERVDTEPAFVRGLQGGFDCILSDYSLPEFDGLRALDLLNQTGLDVPFILVSGSMGEDIAVSAMKQGAADYLLKDRLARLGPAVHHALDQARLRRERRQAQADLQAAHTQLRQLMEHSPAVLYALKVDGQKIVPHLVSENINGLLGFTVPETLRYEWWVERLHPEDRDRAVASLAETMAQGASVTEYRLKHKDGSERWVEDTRRLIRDSSNQPMEIVGIWADITERKRAEYVLAEASRQKVGRQKAGIVRELIVIFGLSALSFAILYYTNALQATFDMLVDKYRNHLDEVAGAGVILLLGFVAFSYRRWRDVQSQVGQHAKTEEALRVLHGELEMRVQQRTAELAKANDALRAEIAEREKAEETIRQSEARFRELAENIHEVFWMTDASKHQMLYISPAYEKIWGRSCQSLYAAPGTWLESIHAEDREHIRRAAAEKQFSGTYDEEYRIIRPDGTQRWIHDRAFPIRNAAGEVHRVVGTAEDITARKQTDRRLLTQGVISRVLADSNSLNEATPKIMEAICESEGWGFGGIWEVDRKSNLLRFLEAWYRPELPGDELAARNRALTFARHVGLPGRVWASGQPLLVPDVARDKNYQRASIATKMGLNSALAFPITLEGEVIGVMDFLGQEIRPTDEKALEMFLGIGRQIGSFFKRKQLEDQFRQAQKMEGIGQLAGGVAHDFNNILAAIQMQSDLLKGSGGLSPSQAEFADEIGTTVQRAAALTRQLLLFSRREVFQPRDLDLCESIGSTTKMLKRILGENVQMQLKLAPQPMFIHADAGMMDQVLMNLVVNARDAMPNGGHLVIETTGVEFDESAVSQSTQPRVGSFVCLSVSDSGCGIPPEILPKIFEPFFTTKDVGKGTGLGLATVFGIVQQHQGWVNVYSELNHGTTFRIYLPRLAKNAHPQSASSTPAELRGGHETILLAEDDPALRASVRNAISRLGYRVLEAPTGVKALEVWKQNRDEISLLLTDLVMPDGMTGKDLAQHILHENPKLKVIYMSGYSAEVVGKNFPLKEGDNFLSKPFRASKLALSIRQKLDAEL